MDKQFKYDAFISYRHTELDKFVAENLHKQLEAFRLPKSIAKQRKDGKTKIERVFRDKEELPLTNNLEDPIVEALKNSEWLIVICSPRLRESLWCKKEIETFVALRGREHVLAVLIEDEPANSFPDELLYEIKQVTNPDGSIEEIKKPVEPLAADVRGNTKKEVLKALKTEKLRLLAAMFQLSYDDLRQRHKERKMRQIMTASLVGGAACLAFGAYSTATALRIQSQKEQIEEQAQEITKQNEELALSQAYSLSTLAEQYLESGNREEAVVTATEALTESRGVALPYTPEAQYILTESLRIYDTGNIYKAAYQYEVNGRINSIEESPDLDTLCIFDDTNTINLFDLENQQIIKQIGGNEYTISGDYGATFLGENRFAYINADGEVCVYDLDTKEEIVRLTPPYAYHLLTDEKGNYLAVNQFGSSYVIYDTNNYEELGETPDTDNLSIYTDSYIFADGTFVYSDCTKDEEERDIYTVHFYDVNAMSEIASYEMGMKYIEDMVIQDGIAYIAANMQGELLSDCDSYMMAIDIASATLLWEYEQKGLWSKSVTLPVFKEAKALLYVTNANANLVDMRTGEVTNALQLESSVVEQKVYMNNSNFLLFFEDGKMVVLGEEQSEPVDLSYLFECKTVSNKNIMFSSSGISVLQRNDNKITVYTCQMGPDVVEVSEVHSLPEEYEELLGDDAVEMAKSYGLDRPEYVLSMYHSDDDKYCFIRYWDYSFAIYDVEKGEVCNTIEDAYPTKWCVRSEKDSNTYLLGYHGCYVLNDKMEPVMWIPQAEEVDIDNQKVYIVWNEKYYEAPIYSADDLLQMAKEQSQSTEE